VTDFKAKKRNRTIRVQLYRSETSTVLLSTDVLRSARSFLLTIVALSSFSFVPIILQRHIEVSCSTADRPTGILGTRSVVVRAAACDQLIVRYGRRYCCPLFPPHHIYHPFIICKLNFYHHHDSSIISTLILLLLVFLLLLQPR